LQLSYCCCEISFCIWYRNYGRESWCPLCYYIDGLSSGAQDSYRVLNASSS
jgi:hypothetical protein